MNSFQDYFAKPILHPNSIQAALYLLNRSSRISEEIEIYRMMYVADRMHLAKYGWTITHENYIPSKEGPKPECLSTELSLFQTKMDSSYSNLISRFFTLTDAYLAALSQADTTAMLTSEIQILREVSLSYAMHPKELKFSAEDDAWKAAIKNKSSFISVLAMAKAGAASEETIFYVFQLLKNSYLAPQTL